MDACTKYLEYVRNTNGCATLQNFEEDFEPVGEVVWHYMHSNGLVMVDDDRRIYLTAEGASRLSPND